MMFTARCRRLLGLSLPPLLALAACSPAFNWRDVRPENTRLSLLLPCKPDRVEKTVPLGGQPTVLGMTGCDAGGATFAVAVADVRDPAAAGAVLAQWQSLTLANMHAPLPGTRTEVVPIKLLGASPNVPPVLVTARGRRADGREVSGQAAYFAQGSQVFQVVLYAAKIPADASEPFFSSLRFD
ncbi:MAG: hypothetical protein JWQ72_3292 [Polaromonas sp.]|nr:hypothetical protein [Polaromonas sp.]